MALTRRTICSARVVVLCGYSDGKIILIGDALDRTQKLLAEYKEMVEEMGGVTALTDGVLEEIGSVIGVLEIKE